MVAETYGRRGGHLGSGTLDGMKVILDVLGWLLVAQGVGGVVNTLLGWWRWAHDLLLVNILPFLHGREIFAAIVIGVLGLVLLSASASMGKPASRT